MQIQNLSLQPSVLLHYLSEIRDVTVQKDGLRFRKNIERIGEIMAYEISKTLEYQLHNTTTPLGVKESYKISENLVVASVLRAGLPMHQGFLNIFDHAESAFLAAFRNHISQNHDKFEIVLSYEAIPDLKDKTLLLVDPMLATGQSLLKVYHQIMEKHQPKKIILVSIIAAPEGITYLKKEISTPVNLWVAAIDDHLNDKKYIVPGLGDAGDLAYGTKAS
jgi:uracil phosphoribosyltransferase